MANLLLGLNPFTITDINTKEITNYKTFKEAFDVAVDGKNRIYIYDLYKLEETIANHLVKDLNYKIYNVSDLKKGLLSQLPESKSFFTAGSKEEKTCIYIKIKKTARKVSEIFNIKSLFGKVTMEEIASTFGCNDDIPLGVACALDWLIEKGYLSYTLPSNALKDLQKECFGRFINGKKEFCYNDFKETFPTLAPEVHDFCIKGLQGGLCLINPKYLGDNNVSGTEYDVNSMYPSVMMDERLPIGTPVYFKGKLPEKQAIVNGHKVLTIQHIRIARMTLKNGHYASVKDQNGDDYITEAENIELNLSNVAMDILFNDYEIEGLEYIDGYKFRSRTGLFDNYINKWMEIKKNAVEGSFERMFAKLMLNSAFGKFISRTDRRQSEWKVVKIGTNKGNLEKRRCLDKTKVEGSAVYSPVGIFITDYARQRLLNAIYNNKENFIYSDTDSIYVKGEATGLTIDAKEVGAWKEEFKFTKINIVGKKQYCVQKTDGTIKVALAGCPENAVIDIVKYEDFFLDKTIAYNYKTYDLDGVEHLNTSNYRIKLLEDIHYLDRWNDFLKQK